MLKRAVAPTPAHRDIAGAHSPFEDLKGRRFVVIGDYFVSLQRMLAPSTRETIPSILVQSYWCLVWQVILPVRNETVT